MIEIIQEQFAAETMMARRDYAVVTGQPLVENPYWFKGQEEYHGLYACIGWPQPVSEKFDQRPGYAAIVAVVKDDRPPENAVFKVVEEIEHGAAPDLIQDAAKLRERWGFGIHPHLLRVFLGDYRGFENVVARFNTTTDNDDRKAFIVSPPVDFDNALAFDLYVSALRSALGRGTKRLYLGKNGIIADRIRSFQRNDPTIMAMGGMIHTLTLQTPWMEQSEPSVFQLPE